MVYESDFYTYRRPYSRPLVSSYSVTGPYSIPSASYHVLRCSPYMPYVAHKRLVSFVHSPVRIYHAGTALPIRLYSRVRPSVLAAELNRIRYLTRPSYEPYTSNYLNSSKYLDFDDETREIRARANSLMRRIHVFVPRPSPSDYADEVLPEKMYNSAYVRRILNTPRTYPVKQLEYLPWYFTELRHLGDGRLACVKYVAGNPVSRRRPYYTLADIRAGDVKSDVNLMSYYLKNRRAAEDALKKQPDEETIRMVQEYIAKKLEEERLEEERKRAEEEVHERIRKEREAQRLAEEKLAEQRRLAEILAQEKLLAEQRAEEARAEAVRQEAARIAQEEKMFAEAVAAAIADEQERIAKEHMAEEALRKQEEEERLATDDLADDDACNGNNGVEEHVSHAELSDQEKEAKPYDVDENDVTEIEEEDLHEEQGPTSPFPEETDDGASSQPLLGETTTDSVQVEEATTGGQKALEESGEQSQPEAEEATADEPHVEEAVTNEVQIEEIEEEKHTEKDEIATEEQQEEVEAVEVDDYWGTHGQN